VKTRFPLTTHDEVYLLTRREEPPTLHLEYRFTGALDEARLREAAGAAVEAHPMLRARLASRRRFLTPPSWEIDPGRPLAEVLRVARCETDAELDALRDALYSGPIDLDEAPALRLVLVKRPGGDTLLLNFHHALSDGVGTLRFFHTIARAYGGLPEPAPPFDPIAARDPNSEVWPRRPHPAPGPPDGAPARLSIPKGAVATIARRGPEDAPGYGFQRRVVPHERRRRLDPQRYGPGVGLNDLLMAALHLAVDAWNREAGEPADYVAVFLPVNNRPPDHAADIVANLTAGGRVASTPGQRADPGVLVRALADRRKALQDGGGFARVQATPPWVQRLLPLVVYAISNPVVGAGLTRMLGDLRMSAVLTCLGRVDDFARDFGPGPGQPAEVWLSGPAQDPPGVSIGTALLNRDLFLTFRVRRARLDDAAAARFADLFVESLERLGG
jgi:NRPS condensation-like uncharacterized protein